MLGEQGKFSSRSDQASDLQSSALTTNLWSLCRINNIDSIYISTHMHSTKWNNVSLSMIEVHLFYPEGCVICDRVPSQLKWSPRLGRKVHGWCCKTATWLCLGWQQWRRSVRISALRTHTQTSDSGSPATPQTRYVLLSIRMLTFTAQCLWNHMVTVRISKS